MGYFNFKKTTAESCESTHLMNGLVRWKCRAHSRMHPPKKVIHPPPTRDGYSESRHKLRTGWNSVSAHAHSRTLLANTALASTCAREYLRSRFRTPRLFRGYVRHADVRPGRLDAGKQRRDRAAPGSYSFSTQTGSGVMPSSTALP